jgi:hypothetical protein
VQSGCNEDPGVPPTPLPPFSSEESPPQESPPPLLALVQAPPTPALTVTTSAPAYDRFEPIMLRATVGLHAPSMKEKKNAQGKIDQVEDQTANRSGEVTVATFEAGTIKVISASVDGKPIVPSFALVRFVDDPVLAQVGSLRTMEPREHVLIPLDTSNVPGTGSHLIVEELHQVVGNIAWIYSLTKPGLYKLQLAYQYTGPDNGSANVFRDRILSNVVTFTVREWERHRFFKSKTPTRVGPYHGNLRCLGNQDFVSRCEFALMELGKSSVVGPIIQGLQRSNRSLMITETGSLTKIIVSDPEGSLVYGEHIEVEVEAPQNAAKITITGNGEGSSADISWNLGYTSAFASDAAPKDPYAGLVNGLYLASLADKGAWSVGTMNDLQAGRTNDVQTHVDELASAIIENYYRCEVGLPLRQRYDNADLVQPQTCPPN